MRLPRGRATVAFQGSMKRNPPGRLYQGAAARATMLHRVPGNGCLSFSNLYRMMINLMKKHHLFRHVFAA